MAVLPSDVHQLTSPPLAYLIPFSIPGCLQPLSDDSLSIYIAIFFFIFFFHFFFRHLLRLDASRHLEKMMTGNVEIGIGSVNETCGPSVLGSCILEWLRRKVG